jgi:hypothetical protein
MPESGKQRRLSALCPSIGLTAGSGHDSLIHSNHGAIAAQWPASLDKIPPRPTTTRGRRSESSIE